MTIDPKVLKQVRKALGLSQQELADRLSLSRVTVNKMERGKLARGIPDAIGERLMSLRDKPRAPKTIGEIADAYGGLPIDDNHLWDNGEDEQ